MGQNNLTLDIHHSRRQLHIYNVVRQRYELKLDETEAKRAPTAAKRQVRNPLAAPAIRPIYKHTTIKTKARYHCKHSL